MKKEMIYECEYDLDGWDPEQYYESTSVGAGRNTYSCEVCGKRINIGEPSVTHKFHPEYSGPRTHVGECDTKFRNSMRGNMNIQKNPKLFSKEQKEIKSELEELFEKESFTIFECIQTNNLNRVAETLDESLIGILEELREYGRYEPFCFDYKTHLKTKIKSSVFTNKIVLNVKDNS